VRRRFVIYAALFAIGVVGGPTVAGAVHEGSTTGSSNGQEHPNTVVSGGGTEHVLESAVAASMSVAAASKDITAKALTDHGCDNTEWGFVITQIDMQSDAPASIHVTWANGHSEDVSLSAFTGGTAHYTTTDNLDSTVTSATASIYDSWSGEFNLSHGPCNEVTTTTTTTTQPKAGTTTTTTTQPQSSQPTTTTTQAPQVASQTVTAQPTSTG